MGITLEKRDQAMQAISITPRNMRLSALIRDPRVRAAFERAERDQGGALVLPAPAPQSLLPAAAAVQRSRSELEEVEP